MSDKHRRQRRILELVQARPVTSQEQLAASLRQDGIATTQATLSRDLREIGVVKGPAGYMIPGDATPAPPSGELIRATKAYLIRGEATGNIAVVHTGPGRATLLALEIDRARMKPVVGTVAGDDTVFIATRTPRDAVRVLRDLKQMAGLR